MAPGNLKAIGEARDSEYRFYEKKMEMTSKEVRQVPDYKSLLSEFDDYVASEKIGSGVSRALSYGFEMGDMVWGKVKSHPWWPGSIFNEAFASPSVRRMRKMDHVLVAFFGDSSYGWFDPAELIPFEPHLAENSQQTKSNHFAKAVEEAMDEASRRSALGLTCKCRKPNNFRPTIVQGYFAVDVLDYELEGVYSSKQIKKARDCFSSVQTLSFLKRCALAPHECDTESLKFCQKKAAVSAFRRAVFEEFDETFEQAFGARSAYALVKTQEPLNKAAPRAPLSGPLVTAETLGDSKSSETSMKVKDSTKQDKYLPRRREEAGDTTVRFSQVQASSQLQGISGSAAGDHVRTPMKNKQPGLENMGFTSSSGDNKGFAQKSKPKMRVNAARFPHFKTSIEQDETDMHSRSNTGSLHPFLKEKRSSEVGFKKVNVLKRVSSEMDSENGPSEQKKKKKKELGSELNCDNQARRKALSSRDTEAKKSSQLGSAQRHSNMLTESVVQLLSKLQALSLDPFFGSSDKSSIRALKQFFLRFRSLVYQKCLAVSHSSDEPSKAEKKRLSSDHQQDIPSIKKVKKTNQEAKDRSTVEPLKPVRERGDSVPKMVEPTMLVMKFPNGTNLPSTAHLKARFGRFGMLDQSATRVFWKSLTCRVVFLYKLDAQTALRYASGNSSLFGNNNIRYYLRDASEVHEPKKTNTDEPLSQEAPTVQLKSCLKEPDNNGNGNRRVKFRRDGKEEPVSSRNNASSTSSVAMEFVSKDSQNIVQSTLPTILPISSQYSKPKHVNIKVDNVEPMLNPLDISEEMMKLLSRCNDVVANVTSLLGYLPYHPL